MIFFVVCFIGVCVGLMISGVKIIYYVLICKFMVRVIKKIFF